MGEVYVSTDIEADGPCPGVHSMLSFASAAFLPGNEEPIATFSANLEILSFATQDPSTMEFWRQNKEAYEETRKDQQRPVHALKKYQSWLKALPGRPVFVAYPAGFDFTYVYWYCHRFLGESPFGFSALDMKTYAMASLQFKNFTASVKKNYPKTWFSGRPHTHVALDDAIEQGIMFIRMLKANTAE